MKIIFYIILFILRRKKPTSIIIFPIKEAVPNCIYWLIKEKNMWYVNREDIKKCQAPNWKPISPEAFYEHYEVASKTWVLKYTKGREVVVTWHKGGRINIAFWQTNFTDRV